MTNVESLPARIVPLAYEIAAATRLLVDEGILDYSGHIAARVPGQNAFMIQNATDSRAGLDPARLLVIDYDGHVLQGSGRPPLELPLHLEILKARGDVQAVLHCHMELAIAFTLMRGMTLVPMRARASRWASGIPTHPDPDLIQTMEQGRALAQTLAEHQAGLIRAHGLVLVAESVPGLLVDAVHFEENARAQMLVLQAGQQPEPLTEAEMASLRHSREFHVGKLWNYYVRKGTASGVIPLDWDLLAA